MTVRRKMFFCTPFNDPGSRNVCCYLFLCSLSRWRFRPDRYWNPWWQILHSYGWLSLCFFWCSFNCFFVELRNCTLHIHTYVPACRDFAGVGLSPVSVRTICHNLPAYICELESFCVPSCASPIRWRSGKSNHNVRIGTAFLRARTCV